MSCQTGLPLALSLLLLVACAPKAPSPAKSAKSVFTELATRQRVDGLSREELAGRRLYQHYCPVCHGATGQGDGSNGYNLKSAFGVQPADLTKLDPPLSMDQLERVISGGGPVLGKSQFMPPWGGTLAPSEIHAVAAYVRSLSRKTKSASGAKTSATGG